MSDKSTHHLHIVLTHEQIATAEDAKRGLFLLDQVYELMYQIARK